MEIMIPSPLETPQDTLERPLSPSNIRLHAQKDDLRGQRKVPAQHRLPPDCSPQWPLQTTNPQYRFEDSTLSLPITTTPKNRQGKIFSIVHSAQRERSASHTSNSSACKDSKPGLTLVSKDKKRIERSASKKREEETSLRTLESFTVTSSSLTLHPDEKENKAAPTVLKIRQPEFLKAHPLRMGKLNGSCMGKLIVQRALQDRQHCFPKNTQNTPFQTRT